MNVTDTHAGAFAGKERLNLSQLFVHDWRSVVVQVNELRRKVIRLVEPGHGLDLGVFPKPLRPVDTN